MGATPLNELSDEELLRRYLTDSDDDGETFIAIYSRYRDVVRAELEAAGLGPQDAESRIGTVFIRALGARDTTPAATPLRERLLTLARGVAHEPD